MKAAFLKKVKLVISMGSCFKKTSTVCLRMTGRTAEEDISELRTKFRLYSTLSTHLGLRISMRCLLGFPTLCWILSLAGGTPFVSFDFALRHYVHCPHVKPLLV